jgi:hypothetical protein
MLTGEVLRSQNGAVKSYASDEAARESERVRKFKAAADSVFKSRKSMFEELAEGAE